VVLTPNPGEVTVPGTPFSVENMNHIEEGIEDVEQAIQAVEQALAILTDAHAVAANDVWPVGSIYMSVESTSPAVLFGGTWTAWGAGRVPVGIDTGDTDFNSVEKTGGSKTHALTPTQIPEHKHSVNIKSVSVNLSSENVPREEFFPVFTG
jgi:hypothetical protein